MKKLIYLLILSITGNIYGQLPATCGSDIPRVVIAGDSWAQFMGDDDSHNTMLNWYGHSDKASLSRTFELCIGCFGSPGSDDYAVSGSEARQWADEVSYNYVQALIDELNAEPTVDWVVLSIGGNDILAGRSGGGWYKNMDFDVPGSEGALFDAVLADTEYIMDQVWLRARPDINFIISSYDYPNFNVSAFLCGFYACDKREDLSRDDNGNGTIDASELITDEEITAMMQSVEDIRQGLADGNPQIFYDNGMGLTHYYYGYDDGLYSDILPGSTLEPQPVSPYVPGGDPNTPTDRNNFRLVGVLGLPGFLSADPIHLDLESYEYKIKHQLDNILFESYRQGNQDMRMTFWSNGSEDGYADVIDNQISTNGIRVGDDGGFFAGAEHDYRGILSFDTDPLPDNAQVTGASIYMMRSSENDNPFEKNDGRQPVLDIKNGYFGSGPQLEVADGTDAASATDIGCFIGEVEEDKYALRIDVDGAALNEINLTGKTQFRVYFDIADWSAEYVNFYDGGGVAAILAPEVAAEQYVPKYEYKVLRKTPNSDSTYATTVVELGPEASPRPGRVLQEKMVRMEVADNGVITEFYLLFTPIEHPGLSKHMSETYGAPGNGFAPFLDVSYQLVLPAELLLFEVEKRNQQAVLNWEVTEEINVLNYEILHTTDGENWHSLNKIAANGLEKYDYIHQNPSIGTNYYRLKINDLDGRFEYSNIRTVDFDPAIRPLSIFPNPAERHFTIQTTIDQATNLEVLIYDALGKVVFQQNEYASGGIFRMMIDDLSDFPTGTFLVEMRDDLGHIYHGRFVVVRGR